MLKEKSRYETTINRGSTFQIMCQLLPAPIDFVKADYTPVDKNK